MERASAPQLSSDPRTRLEGEMLTLKWYSGKHIRNCRLKGRTEVSTRLLRVVSDRFMCREARPFDYERGIMS